MINKMNGYVTIGGYFWDYGGYRDQNSVFSILIMGKLSK